VLSQIESVDTKEKGQKYITAKNTNQIQELENKSSTRIKCRKKLK